MMLADVPSLQALATQALSPQQVQRLACQKKLEEVLQHANQVRADLCIKSSSLQYIISKHRANLTELMRIEELDQASAFLYQSPADQPTLQTQLQLIECSNAASDNVFNTCQVIRGLEVEDINVCVQIANYTDVIACITTRLEISRGKPLTFAIGSQDLLRPGPSRLSDPARSAAVDAILLDLLQVPDPLPDFDEC